MSTHFCYQTDHSQPRGEDLALFERAKTHVVTMGFAPNTSDWAMTVPQATVHFYQAVGVIEAAAALLKAGRLKRLIEGVRADTVSEVLDQAEMLRASNHVLAATVLAGGALETPLLHLFTRNGLAWSGDGSIGKYDQAVAQARNAGTVTVYSVTDSKLIGGWGGMRNDAAHDPTNYRRTADDVRSMIEGIRQFIARVP